MDTPEDTVQRAGRLKKPRVYKESEKVQHTTHWDMDYLPLKEVDALYEKGDNTKASKAFPGTWLKKEQLARFFKRLPAWLILLLVILLFGRFVITALFHFIA
jgi:hypothetical protein